MKPDMATRKPTDVTFDLKDCTEFCLHKSQQTTMSGMQSKVIDYTEHRLIKYAETIKDEQQRIVLAALINDYVSGHVAIAWNRGKPTYVRVIKAA